MRLDYVVLELSSEFPTRLSRDFGLRTRYVCNYLGRQMRLAGTASQTIDRLIVEGTPDPSTKPELEGSALAAQVYFDHTEYGTLSVDGRHEFYLAMLARGFETCGSEFPDVPVRKLGQWMAQFREGGYVNSWTYKKRRLVGTGLAATLQCSLDTKAFELRLEVRKAGRLCYDRRILRTLPNEYLYQHRFADVRLAGSEVVVLDEGGKVVHSVSIARFEEL